MQGSEYIPGMPPQFPSCHVRRRLIDGLSLTAPSHCGLPCSVPPLPPSPPGRLEFTRGDRALIVGGTAGLGHRNRPKEFGDLFGASSSKSAYRRCIPHVDPCSLGCRSSILDPVPRPARSGSLATMVEPRVESHARELKSSE